MMEAAHIGNVVAFTFLGAITAFLHLKLLSLNVRALTGHPPGVLTVGISLGRAVITLAALLFAVLHSAIALIAALAGFLLCRALLMRRPEFLLP